MRWKFIRPRHCEQRMAVWAARDLIYKLAGRSFRHPGEVCTGTCFLPFFDSISAHLPRRRARLGMQLCVLCGSLCMSCMPAATGAPYSTNVLICQDWTPGWCVQFRGTSSGTVITSTLHSASMEEPAGLAQETFGPGEVTLPPPAAPCAPERRSASGAVWVDTIFGWHAGACPGPRAGREHGPR